MEFWVWKKIGYGFWVWNLGMEFRGGLYVSKVWSLLRILYGFFCIVFRISFVFFGVGGMDFFLQFLIYGMEF